MANRVVEVFYQLKDLFSGQVKKIAGSYDRLRGASRTTADQIERDNRRAATSFKGLTDKVLLLRNQWLTLASAIGVGAAFRELRQFAAEADNVGKISERLGVATDELTALGYAAERSGVDFRTMSTALQRLIRRSGEAAQGFGEARGALAELGIDAAEFNELSLEEKMAQLADAFAAVSNQGDRVRLAFKLFDTEGVKFLNVIQGGSEALRTLTEEAREAGAVISEDLAEAAEKFNDTAAKFSLNLKGIGISAGGPALNFFNDLAAQFGASANELDNLRAQLEFTRAQIEGDFSLSPFDFGVRIADLAGLRDLRAEYEAIAARIAELEAAQESAAATTAETQAAAIEQAAILRDQEQAYADLADSRDSSLKRLKATLTEETAELRKAKQEQANIERQFQDLVEDITTPADEDVSLSDVFLANTRARAALEQGQAEQSIRLAQRGGELLRKLKEEGSETGGTLRFLATQLQQVANEAAQAETAAEQAERDAALAQVQTFEAQLAVLKATAKDAGAGAALEYAEGWNTTMTTLRLSAPEFPVPGASPIYRNGSSFSDRAPGEKRGNK